jgi:hypothetical protein
LKDQAVDGRMGSQWTLGLLVGGVEWIQLAQDRDRWRAVVNAVMNFRVLAPRSYLVSRRICWAILKRGQKILMSSLSVRYSCNISPFFESTSRTDEFEGRQN